MHGRAIFSGSPCRTLAAALACGAWFNAHQGAAQEIRSEDMQASQPGSTPTIGLGKLIDALLAQGQADRAGKLLDELLARRPDDQQLRFLRGLVAIEQADYDRAIRIFRGLLVDHPEAVRVRLELARAFFLDGDYHNADRQFRAVRATDVPAEVAANIDAFLFQIRQSKDWSYSASVAIAPDTNLNGASAGREITLYGLKFKLSEDARKHSGIGVALDGSAEWAPRISETSRLRLGIAAQRREYSGSQFDDMTAAAYVGPRFVGQSWDVSLLATGSKRWFGGKSYAETLGARVEASHDVGPRLVLNGSLGALHLNYDQSGERGGMVYSASFGALRQIDQLSAVSMKLVANRQEARARPFANWSGFGALGYFRDLPAGFSVFVEPAIAFARYDAPMTVFDKKRKDLNFTGTLAIINRRIVLSRFTPRLAYSYTRQVSNISLFDFARHRVEIGLTTAF